MLCFLVNLIAFHYILATAFKKIIYSDSLRPKISGFLQREFVSALARQLKIQSDKSFGPPEIHGLCCTSEQVLACDCNFLGTLFSHLLSGPKQISFWYPDVRKVGGIT